MKSVGLNGAVRAANGKSEINQLRNEERVPCVMYGGGEEPLHFSAAENDLNKLIYPPNAYIVQVEIDGKTQDAIVRESQFHPTTDQLLHMDFLRVNDKDAVELQLPVKTVGTAKGVRAGGKLVMMMRRVKVKGIPAQLPDVIEVDVTDLGLGKTIRVEDVTIEGVQITSPAQAGIALVDIPRSLRGAGAASEEGAE